MPITVKIGKRFQVVLPKAVREKLSLQEGDELVVEVARRGILLVPKPKSYTKHMEGLHKEVWEGLDIRAFLEEERKEWER